MICTFFGHRDAPNKIEPTLRSALVDMIENYGVDKFYVGNNGNFDALVLKQLRDLSKIYSITFYVVLAYMPEDNNDDNSCRNTILPEGVEMVPRKFAINYRNKWMINNSDVVITYVRYPSSGAAKFKAMAEKKNKIVVSL